ncbi:methylated-DNA--[protein]-cysteine S-methyltransferase [Terrabacter sp. MAHUQ-38]|jgi:methylated-DNA-[protein]-cysteine S-methyltransferase|uniref:methylated-DNA--[protein]-cysteine S-methyltransferase n=1 Tax=unclassified Terrabacter TaxID=2630222 RepID=UPI00165D6239|nr:methylated-DNA--[protein]-cysteine S-methyltransferase [Terrabacter sp. MAHUQ-38]MBC9823830.1 methylated-DNA--[protein]-cysteine S-methyltransferase [Terrabacter sp. MAHUQ-38]
MSDKTIQLLTQSADADDERLVALHAALVRRATSETVVDATYRIVDSPVGRLLLAATDSGVVRVAYEVEDHDRVLDALGASIGSRILRGGDRLDDAARELEAYFGGRRHDFDVRLDLRLAHGFRLAVLRHLGEIPYGSTESYGQVAVAAGSPRAVRAVGSACATNPLPILVPCHRVVRSDGTLGGYLGGLPAKERLLELERAA